ncbi:uncharacterized protein LOC103042203 [Astyanax mexicanus]|uniref:uncharacterized protein LOC103042203 n=1 Tax=Astyanax mexicanus TaxID=7994 RepID=UPI0020CB2733|nr:uncharacterized protein LOC103042203 [Astyanax mexicanus]
MNCIEKRHVSHKASMPHLYYLDSFMDELDREVMNLTDRAFKSLCIGDEAIYNDSEFSPPLVSCHKPLVEEVSKKTQQTCSMAFKKQETQPHLNGVNNMPWQMNKSSSLFAAFAAKKNGDATKMTNGDSWDKSALLSIQQELSEFSSDYQNNIAHHHNSQVKNHLKSSEKSNKSIADTSTQSGKLSKSKHSKSSKLKKLNSKNFFLHSELSPFQSWRDLNKFPFGLENIEIFQSNGPPEWYDSPLYKKLTMSHRLHNSELHDSELHDSELHDSEPHDSELNDSIQSKGAKQCSNPKLPQNNTDLDFKTLTSTSMPLKSEKQPEPHKIPTEPQPPPVLLKSSEQSELRSQSEGAPWRKNRSRAKSAVPIGQSLLSSLTCEKAKAVEEVELPIKKDVRTMEEQSSTSSTPFNILQLLTPVIPSRQGTGSSEVLQSVLSPSTLDLPVLAERDLHPSPEIKREGYKSIASSLLFNLKDNRKRVKAMYSPPKFRSSDPTDQNKLSPLAEQVLTKTGQEVAESSDAKIASPVHPKAHKSPASVPQETAGQQKSTPSGHINGGLPDDFLALSLLQAGNGSSPCLKSNKSPVVNKATYPSLNLYRKASPEECMDAKTVQALSVPGSHPNLDKSTTLKEMDGKERQRKTPNTPVPSILVNKPTDHTNKRKSESIHTNDDKNKGKLGTVGNVQTEKVDIISLREKYPLALMKKPNVKTETLSPVCGRNQDKANMGETEKVEQRLAKDSKERMEAKAKHVFSARQNNYIKSQRSVSVDVHEEEYGHGGEDVACVRSKSEVAKENVSRMSEITNVSEERKSKQNGGANEVKLIEIAKEGKLGGTSIRESVKNEAFNMKDNNLALSNISGLSSEQKATKGDAFSIKGNTSAKRALFISKEQSFTKAAVAAKKENTVMDKYEAAKAALEEVIAERNQRKKQSQDFSSTDRDIEIDKVSSSKCQSADYEQDLITQEHYRQAIAMSQKDMFESAAKDRRGGQKGFSDFKSSSQIVQSMSERDTKHGESRVAEVNLAGPCKQEGAGEHGQRAAGQIKYRERDRSGRRERHQSEPDNVKALDKVTKHKEREHVPKIINLMKESSRVPSTESRLTTQVDDCTAVQKKSSSFKPEVPPRRGRAGSQNEERLLYEIERREDRERVDKTGENVMKVKANLPKERGPVRGHVSALKEKFNKEQEAPSSATNVHDYLALDNGLKENPPKKDKVKLKESVEKEKVLVPSSTPASETTPTKQQNKNPERIDVSSSKSCDINPDLSTVRQRQMNETVRESNNAEETKEIAVLESDLATKKEENIRVIKESPLCASEASEVPEKRSPKPSKSKDSSKNSVKQLLSDLFGKAEARNVKPEMCASVKEIPVKTPETPESIQAESPSIHSIKVYDILKQPEPLSPVNLTQFEQGNLLLLSNPTPESTLESLAQPEVDLASPARTCEENFENLTEEKSSEPSLSERLSSPPSDVDKGGWVRCLIESARNLTPTSQSTASTPTMGKPVLFKVKDNTFNSSPVTKTVRPILHKTIPEICQLWSPRESLSGSERGEEDLYKDCVEVQSPTILSPTPPSTPARSPQPDQSSIGYKGKVQLNYLTVPEEDERQSAVSSDVSEGIESCGTSIGDAVEEIVVTLPTEDPEESKLQSERSGSACSGLENQSQVKPPVVPPKTEKALRRAMRLTTRRIQKAESKSKSERKGRSCEKNTSHKPERRHHSSDKVLSSQSELQAPAVDFDGSNQSTGENKPHRGERYAREPSRDSSNQEGHYSEEMLQLESPVNRNNNQAKMKKMTNFSNQSRQIPESGHHFDSKVPVDAPSERPGRTSDKKSPPERLDRRAHSLDRYLTNMNEVAKKPPLRQNSIEHTYASNIVTQSFPMTQRKLLQDPDSGQYFVVDMPVQVKTKTFFDPETGSYVQLPVQSHEAPVPQAQSMEVVKAPPPLVLYHGFVPMPVSTLPAQNSSIKLGSVVTPNDLEGFESSEIERHDDEIYQKPKPYPDPASVHVSQDCLGDVETVDSVR